MDTHIKVIAWLWIFLGVLGVLGALCFGASSVGGGLISEDETAILATSITAAVCGGFFILGSAIEILAGIGLLKYREWARILAIILGILNLFALPLILPFLLGIYTLWGMFNEETKQLFEHGGGRNEALEANAELPK